MTPERLRALLDAATPKPGDVRAREYVEYIHALRNLAPKLLALWEAAIDVDEEIGPAVKEKWLSESEVHFRAALAALAAVGDQP